MNDGQAPSRDAGAALGPVRSRSRTGAGPQVKRVRTRSHWFREGRARTPDDLAGVAAFTIWRQAGQCLRNLRAAGFAIDAGVSYFEFLAECLIFLAQAADRFAYEGIAEQREAFTPAMVRQLAGHFSGNWTDLLGDTTQEIPAHTRFIAHYNRRIDAYLSCADDFCAMRLLADHLLPVLAATDAAWVHAQFMEYEGPALLEQLRSALLKLLDDAPSTERRTAGMTGE